MSQQLSDVFDEPPKKNLVSYETWWVDRQEALECAGYRLRRRYHPNWQPSWAGTNKTWIDCEDGLIQPVSYVTYAY
jgi:hypothetical protein